MILFEQLSTREYAVFTWLVGLFLFCLSKREIRSALWGVLKCFASPMILTPLSLATAYIIACVWLLSLLSIWTFDHLKSVLFWSAGTAFVAFFSANKIVEDSAYFSKEVRQLFTITGIVTFITEMHSYHFALELFAVPIITFIVLMHEFSKTNSDYEQAGNLFGGALVAIGLLYFLASLIQTVEDWHRFQVVEVLRDFFIPALLTILFLPFLYILSRYIAYESAFANLGIWMDDKKLLRQTKWSALWQFRSNIDLLQRWQRNVQRSRPNTLENIKDSMADLKRLAKREKEPPLVAKEDGWSPYAAMKFLKESELKTGDYHPSFGDEWYAGSNMLEVGRGLWKSNIAYYITGHEQAATELKLKLNLNQPDDAEEARELFSDMCHVLLFRAVPHCEADPIERKIGILREFTLEHQHWDISLTKETFEGGAIAGGYSLTFVVALRSH